MLLRCVPGGVLVAAVAIAGCGGGGKTAAGAVASIPPSQGAGAPASHRTPVAVSLRPSPSLTISPSSGGKHDRFVVAMTSRRATGVFGKTRRGYAVEAHAVRPASACVNNRDQVFRDRPAGDRVRATLDPARGEGGPLGWCPGLFRGTVTYSEAFACPPVGTCHPPHGFPTWARVVARFSFRVR
jgi:hypothetical protein